MSTTQSKKSQNVLYGIVGENLQQVARQVPAQDADSAMSKIDESQIPLTVGAFISMDRSHATS